MSYLLRPERRGSSTLDSVVEALSKPPDIQLKVGSCCLVFFEVELYRIYRFIFTSPPPQAGPLFNIFIFEGAVGVTVQINYKSNYGVFRA